MILSIDYQRTIARLDTDYVLSNLHNYTFVSNYRYFVQVLQKSFI